MTAEGHLIFAIASAVFAKRAELTPILASADWWHIIPATLLTCLLPDIDHPKSFLGQRLRWLSWPVARVFGHRGFTHSLLAVGGGVALLQLKLPSDWLFPADVLQGMVLGYLSHIVADMLTPAGVPLLWPCRWRFRLPLLRSQKGNQLERLLCLVLVGCAIWLPPGMPPFGASGWTTRAISDVQKGFTQIIERYQAPEKG
ncbi:metal-dependent hydrolase [Erwinia amylovora]|uniref:Inner membrane protein ydjM n=4 Tax=Erwinia amylovora TaxID=552 RepID=A0A831A3G2_ERWAM|nr:metal-dependent hydrolase [Erwinia amylovora]CBX80509.1 Inner membrane protein ydjM precursor [Erwinia amylovora ATCC BAA-2158]CDK15142.1 Inner membrane protein ydjM precursor [Erwinia amylovora LA635]CDK18509.1 Inner membrane protein ydjM precursor [Erwinia amylovora LA636]CDK21878.1 Inner membrane protein ydjM precursor [Erwinia amylovora LA637]ATZ11451.1 metal-dependent hydrolase [Erwinia amylovora]